MKFTALAAGVLLFAAGAHAADKSSGPLASEAQRTSYAIGLDVGQSLARQGVMPDVNAFLLGVQDGLSGTKPQISKPARAFWRKTRNRPASPSSPAAFNTRNYAKVLAHTPRRVTASLRTTPVPSSTAPSSTARRIATSPPPFRSTA